MKRKLSLLLAMVLAMTMVMGMSVAAFAENNPSIDSPYGTLKGNWTCWNEFAIHYVYIDNNQYLGFDSDGWQFLGVASPNAEGMILIGDEIARKEPSNPKLYVIYNSVYNNEGGYYDLVPSECECEFIPKSTNASGNGSHVHNFTWQTITEPTKDSDGLEGEVCSCGATRNTQPLSAFGFILNDYAPSLIKAAKPGQTVTFEFGEWNSFPKSFMAKLVDKSAQNVTFVFKYKWNHKAQTITIPAGTPIDLNFDWYGPAKMAELYGAN